MEKKIKKLYQYIKEREKFNYGIVPEASTEDWRIAIEMEALFKNILS